MVRRFEGGSGHSGQTTSSSLRSNTNTTASTTPPALQPVDKRQAADDISRIPLDAKLMPKQLSKDSGNKKTKGKKSSSEKKQERKAAKTLSAILLAFIITWTPYSVLVVVNAILGKELADIYIPEILWQFSYYLCYINSTVNPVLYALCNAAFRRTYVRILTCRWRSRARQPVSRHYYG